MFDQEFIGFTNYKEVLTDPYFHLAFSNSICVYIGNSTSTNDTWTSDRNAHKQY